MHSWSTPEHVCFSGQSLIVNLVTLVRTVYLRLQTPAHVRLHFQINSPGLYNNIGQLSEVFYSPDKTPRQQQLREERVYFSHRPIEQFIIKVMRAETHRKQEPGDSSPTMDWALLHQSLILRMSY